MPVNYVPFRGEARPSLRNEQRSAFRLASLALCCLAVSACGVLPSFGTKSERREQIYTLDPAISVVPVSTEQCTSLALGDALAAPGYRTSRMAYSTAPFEINYFAYARWADSVARLLRRPLQRAFEAHGGFAEVLAAPALAPTDFRAELGDVSLVQRFESRQSAQSIVELTASIRVFSVNPNQVLASKLVQLNLPAPGDPASGVNVANDLVSQLINEAVSLTYLACTSAKP
ncbi:MAG: ABC-type transport auxiliary lipoprotein family protein [Gammaproteobacteria bacterium]